MVYMNTREIESSPVMITRGEYEELIKARVIIGNAFKNMILDDDGKTGLYTCVETELLNLFPEKMHERLEALKNA
jgi:hypothetical protein